MDNQTVPTPNQPSNFLNRKVVLTILAVIVLAEVLWAIWTLTKPTPKTTSSPPVATRPQTLATISLQADKKTIKVGEKVRVTINLSSNVKTDGTDLIIDYDPKLLSVEASGSAAITGGTIYNNYPQNKLDETAGKITVSGITDQTGGVLANGVFGTIIFQGKASGNTKISLEFTPGSTTDSNLIESGTGKDVLGKVENLELKINP